MITCTECGYTYIWICCHLGMKAYLYIGISGMVRGTISGRRFWNIPDQDRSRQLCTQFELLCLYRTQLSILSEYSVNSKNYQTSPLGVRKLTEFSDPSRSLVPDRCCEGLARAYGAFRSSGGSRACRKSRQGFFRRVSHARITARGSICGRQM